MLALRLLRVITQACLRSSPVLHSPETTSLGDDARQVQSTTRGCQRTRRADFPLTPRNGKCNPPGALFEQEGRSRSRPPRDARSHNQSRSLGSRVETSAPRLSAAEREPTSAKSTALTQPDRTSGDSPTEVIGRAVARSGDCEGGRRLGRREQSRFRIQIGEHHCRRS
jgi:hypothetical protein